MELVISFITVSPCNSNFSLPEEVRALDDHHVVRTFNQVESNGAIGPQVLGGYLNAVVRVHNGDDAVEGLIVTEIYERAFYVSGG
jgi:hypothetical protein